MINDESYVNILKNSFRYDVMQICFHILKKYVDIFVIVSSDGLIQSYDVGMLQLFQNLYLTVGPLSVSCMLKSIKNLFESENSFG